MKAAILQAQDHVCLACQQSLNEVEFDHIQALAFFGDNAPDNWAALCARPATARRPARS
jgi:hypothetical protein